MSVLMAGRLERRCDASFQRQPKAARQGSRIQQPSITPAGGGSRRTGRARRRDADHAGPDVGAALPARRLRGGELGSLQWQMLRYPRSVARHMAQQKMPQRLAQMALCRCCTAVAMHSI